MMNEIKEFEEYTCNLKRCENPRLMFDIFKKNNHLMGIARPLIIIARHELQKRHYFDQDEFADDKRKAIIEEVKKCLKEWIGFEKETNKITEYDSWLADYYKKLVSAYEKDKKTKEQLLSWEVIKKTKSPQFAKKSLKETNTEKNTLNVTTYESAIAEAVYQGPLKRYYLVLKKDAKEALLKKNQKGKKLEVYNNLLKVIGAYLIKREYTGKKFNVVKMVDLANWLQCKSINSGCKSYFKNLQYKEKDILENQTVSNNITKIRINQEFLDDFDFRIVSEENFSEADYDLEKYVYYSDIYGAQIMDAGSPKNLIENCKYDKIG